jgi:hypothetical protein
MGPLKAAGGNAPQMGSVYNFVFAVVRQINQGVIRRRRFGEKGVKSGPGDFPADQGLTQE